MTVTTVGHGTLDAAAFAKVIADAGIDTIVDVRRYPGSRRYPHFARESMEQWLPENRIAYRSMPALGGRRRVSESSPNTALRNEQFRGYADHMATKEFSDAVDELLALARDPHRIAVMCAESVWWRCHRRLLADHLVLCARVSVDHLFHNGRLEPHAPMPQAHVIDDHLVYGPATLL